ncbi:MAG TPA: phosphate ABC transporter permease PstA [Tepidisphaeraceae bacterium]|jgi:phosphate transport system permease protein
MDYPVYNIFSRNYSRVMFGLCVLFTGIILALLVLVTGYLISIGAHSLSIDFFTRLPIPQGMEGYPGGMKNALVGTVVLIALASSVGIPIGMLTGIYLSEYSANSFLAGPTRFICDVLTGVPSIVVGILGYELVVRPIGHFNGYAGGLALAFIMVPIVARTTEEMLRLVPNSYREASIALGATKARTILKVVLPAATGSVITGIMLAIARVAGETAPLLFTTLGSRLLVYNPDDPFPSLTQQIYDYATKPDPAQQKLAWSGILVLISLIFVLNVGIRYFARSIQSMTA